MRVLHSRGRGSRAGRSTARPSRVRLRPIAVGIVLLALLALPPIGAFRGGLGPVEAAALGLGGLRAAVDSVGWVLWPQLLLALGVLGLALERIAAGAAGLPERPAPRWLDPAVESALLLGMLGTISGMVRGFVGLSPEELEPGPLVHSLGTALRSSFVGFGIALVGVWLRAGREAQSPEARVREVHP